MAQLRERLPTHLQEAMQLRVAVVYGNCDVSTASAAGYRFFGLLAAEAACDERPRAPFSLSFSLRPLPLLVLVFLLAL